MRIGIVGSRSFSNLKLVADYVRTLPVGTIIASGGARGVDHHAAETARQRGMTVEEFLPNWDEHGTKAGFVRNEEIVSASAKIVAFWDGKSAGTLDTIEKARAAGVPVTIIDPNGSSFDEKPTNEDAFDDDDPQDGATQTEYRAQRAKENGDDYDAVRDSMLHPSGIVKLFTVAVRFACAVKTTDRTAKDGRRYETQSQLLFTIRNNRILLNLVKNAQPLKPGEQLGRVYEIYGADFTEEEQLDEKTGKKYQIRFVKRALPIVKRSPVPAAKAISVPPPPPIDRTRLQHMAKLRGELTALRYRFEWDDMHETEIIREIEEKTREIARLETTSNPALQHGAGVALDALESKEMRELIRAQIADDCQSRTAEPEFNDSHDPNAHDASDAGDDGEEEDVFDLLDMDEEDDAAITRSTEPWADSSTPIGATVDEDCYTCPSRMGATCIRIAAGASCVLN